jgi:predicted short-subunit dehydrogenase-like oxidoreductase (DUF2520 family)
VSVEFVIIGAGKVGRALACLLAKAGYHFVGAASRTLESAQAAARFAGGGEAADDPARLTPQADLVFVTTPDAAIASVCEALAASGALTPGAVVAHCSGALPSSVLRPAREAGCHVGSLHPCQAFASAGEAVRVLPGSYCCIEGDLAAVEALEEVARVLHMQIVKVPTSAKPLYHAAACVASNYLVALQHAAVRLQQAAGIGREAALQCLLPLVQGTVSNIERAGLPNALTGPIERGDAATVASHLHAIAHAAPDLLPMYRELGHLTVEVALAKGNIDRTAADELLHTLAPADRH